MPREEVHRVLGSPDSQVVDPSRGSGSIPCRNWRLCGLDFSIRSQAIEATVSPNDPLSNRDRVESLLAALSAHTMKSLVQSACSSSVSVQHVAAVVLMSAKDQMARIDAWRVVAIVADDQARVSNHVIPDGPGITVRHDRFEKPMAEAVPSSKPIPASRKIVWNVDFAPEIGLGFEVNGVLFFLFHLGSMN